MTDPLPSLGERVAFYRKRRGLSQVELGRLIGRSESWVSQVERNTRKVDRLSVLAQVAEVLGVPVSDLAPDAPAEPVEPDAESWRTALRLALTGHPALPLLFSGTAGEVSSAGDAQDRADDAWSLVHASRYTDAGPALVPLISELESAVRSAVPDQRPAVARALAAVYQAVTELFVKVGDIEVAWLAADRALFAAERAGNRGLVAAGHHRLAHTFLSAGRLQQARHAATVAAEALRTGPEGLGVEGQSALGALCLVRSIIEARRGDRRSAWQAIEEAETLAGVVGAGRNDFNLEFGPANVALHAVAVAVELGDAGDALDRAGRVDTTGLSAERRGRFLVDVARAHAQRRDRGDAIAALLEAERIAPEQIRDHPKVRVLVRDLLQDPGWRSDQDLRGLADRCGVVA
ncbi:helix-turn-helix transcriptional regulator [Frankia sp. AgB1.9]|uniref:helix-turn-helix domain-containing protein n=1 Tax=unclassified Frankia TaxID=2632575 RepID=UPI001932852B|nr:MULTISPECIES: helix-turn-helix transcriptional regulator [unclassified Frankia]MBL7492557.1 helix-turn-helix transcriptional regulator [Frankia sp. AgW1.1]MBL7546712.1 helix-turn-helix transcriptional regulator [Frankia sp. AgB1.9]MBL7622870.1 helix-turn-helix transcriptional regulator [Frankia sp. AgB1.8]